MLKNWMVPFAMLLIVASTLFGILGVWHWFGTLVGLAMTNQALWLLVVHLLLPPALTYVGTNCFVRAVPGLGEVAQVWSILVIGGLTAGSVALTTWFLRAPLAS